MYLSLNISSIIAKSADPDEMQHNFHLSIHCLPNYPSIHRVNSPLSDKFDQIMPLGPRPVGHMFYISFIMKAKKILLF